MTQQGVFDHFRHFALTGTRNEHVQVAFFHHALRMRILFAAPKARHTPLAKDANDGTHIPLVTTTEIIIQGYAQTIFKAGKNMLVFQNGRPVKSEGIIRAHCVGCAKGRLPIQDHGIVTDLDSLYFREVVALVQEGKDPLVQVE